MIAGGRVLWVEREREAAALACLAAWPRHFQARARASGGGMWRIDGHTGAGLSAPLVLWIGSISAFTAARTAGRVPR